MKHGIAAVLFALTGCGAVDEPAPTGTAHVRVAHLSPDAPAVDFCVASHGTNDFTGPILTQNGHLTGLPYANATKYFDLPADQYDVRIVAPNAPDCGTALGGLPDATNLPALADGVSATIAAEGLVAFGSPQAFTLKAYVDDTTVDATMAKLRFIHASPGTPAVDVGIGGGVLFTSVFSDIAYGNASVTTNGYVTTAPIHAAEISARAHGSLTDALAIKPAELPAGAIATAFAIGQLSDSSLRVLLCVDNAAPNALLSQCSVVGGTPERAHVRFAHLSPDTPAVDVCLAPAGGEFTTSLLKTLQANDGLAYPQVTNYVDLPVGTYDARIIHATATGCATSAIPDTKNISIHAGATATVAAIGVLDPSGAAAANPALKLAVFTDDTTVSNGQAKLRFIHASPGTPAVDIGLGSGVAFTKVFSNVSFGNIAVHAPLDAAGFVETAPVSSTVAARLAGDHNDALVTPAVTLAPNMIATAFAIGGKTGAATNPLAVLVCVDSAAPAGLLASCSQL
ncbi:MAG: DUF4397 domain-containing protein [Kofleriaceae bacterium]